MRESLFSVFSVFMAFPALSAALPVPMSEIKQHGLASNASNVLLFVVDNMRPSLGSYGVKIVSSPNMDALAANGTLFARAYCQLAWCSPSRNSFLTGRRPDTTRVWGFNDDFRSGAVGGEHWVTLPEHFKLHGYWTSSVGKVFHPDKPPNYDFPRSWSEPPENPAKPSCPGGTMACAFDDGNRTMDHDRTTADGAIERLRRWQHAPNGTRGFFLAVGFSAPRLPWSYPASAAASYPPAEDIPAAKHWRSPPPFFAPPAPRDDSRPTRAGQMRALEWFRPVEVDFYSDVRNVTHDSPMPLRAQQQLRRAYYSAISHVDRQVGRVLHALDSLGLTRDTIVVLTADHGQNVGEHNMWSMMNLLETSLRVPLIVRPAPRYLGEVGGPGGVRGRSSLGGGLVDWQPAELIDLFPTLVSLAGLPAPRGKGIAGRDLTSRVLKPAAQASHTSRGDVDARAAAALLAAPAAFSQITRCTNCTLAYARALPEYRDACHWDARADAASFTVPCCTTPRERFDWMGVSVRTASWRLTRWCAWNGTTLNPRWQGCEAARDELFDHRADRSLFDVDSFDNKNVADLPSLASVRSVLGMRLLRTFNFTDL